MHEKGATWTWPLPAAHSIGSSSDNVIVQCDNEEASIDIVGRTLAAPTTWDPAHLNCAFADGETMWHLLRWRSFPQGRTWAAEHDLCISACANSNVRSLNKIRVIPHYRSEAQSNQNAHSLIHACETMKGFLQPDQRQKQNRKGENLLIIHRASFRWMKESGLILNQEILLSAYDISKKVIHLLRHSQTVQREEDGAVQFWRIENYLQNQFPQTQYWSDDRRKACLAARGGAKRRYQYCTDISGTIVCLRALQGHSGRNLIDPSLQDNVVIQSGFFQIIYHIGCAFNLHSIINNGLIPGGQNSSKRQMVLFLPFVPRDKGHKDPEKIDLKEPRRTQYLHSAWKKHQDTIYWVDINLAIKKGLTFYQTRSNAIILQGTLPAYCIPKVERLKTGEVLCERAYMSLRIPPKISLRHDWTKELGSEVARQPREEFAHQPRGEVSRHAKFFQPTQPIPKPICDRSGQ